MRNSVLKFAILAGGTAAFVISAVQFADAKTTKPKPKPTYEEAWSICTKELDRSHILKVDAGQRYAAGGACMHRYGYQP
jgi:hypothetical protein